MQYAIEADLTADEFIDVLQRSTLAARRPVDSVATISKMLANADLIVTARNDRALLVGVARAMTDFAYCTYLSDLAVDVAFQSQGIGRSLIAAIHDAAGLDTRLILLAAPDAVTYYAHLSDSQGIGMHQHPSCWTIPPASDGPSGPS
ncbi:hypothetical protein K227x_38560 [Rubripirellula lacrimiformis]|uniref:N-acetyltransferase domain-containing protein n=1 Tax=Rubripirellula lacrimiformis TaxID=1930273 RepID=A0A517NEA0_9BACT|nr:GNAT family N-acetyltransferase [Rubripirellula lacrimiformis]QDT05456.1 hypothetical protein K227x_38560 [Rubripirellula lacrimiformis]